MDHSIFFNSRSNLVDPDDPLRFCSLLLLVLKNRFKISPSKPFVEKPRNLLNIAKQLSSHRQPFPSISCSNPSNSPPTPSPTTNFSPLETNSPLVPSAGMILSGIYSSLLTTEAKPPKDPSFNTTRPRSGVEEESSRPPIGKKRRLTYLDASSQSASSVKTPLFRRLRGHQRQRLP